MLGLLLWLLIVVAPLPIGAAGSSAGPHTLALILLGAWLALSGTGLGRQASVVGIGATLLLLHFGLTALLSPCHDLLLKSALSALLLMLLLWSLAIAAERAELCDVTGQLRLIIGVVVLSVLLDKGHLIVTNASPFIRPSGIYSEPSHLALSIAPALTALIAAPGLRNKLWGWIGSVTLILLSGSATLFILLGLCLLVVLLAQPTHGRSVKIAVRALLAVAVAVGLAMASPYRDEFAQRVAGLSEISTTSNVSSLIYLNGWQSALRNLETSQLLGLGINRMGCNPRPVTDVTDILEFFELGDSNYNDGSFTVAKLLSEYGLAGMLWMAAMLVFLMRVVVRNRRTRQDRNSSLRALLLGCLVVFTLGAFIRGTGYFSGPFTIGFLAYLLLRKEGIWPSSPAPQPGEGGSS